MSEIELRMKTNAMAPAGVGRRLCVLAALGSLWASQAKAQKTSIQGVLKLAAASDLRAALPALLEQFTRQTSVEVQVSYGSSGHFARQIQQGLPIDVFLSADQTWVQVLQRQGFTNGDPQIYAHGRLAWVSAKAGAHAQPDLKVSMEQLQRVGGKLAIANPDHAPYGRAAVQVLQSLGMWEVLRPSLVMGENVAQALQFASTGAALAAITAWPLVTGPVTTFSGVHQAIPATWHAPLRQQMVAIKQASDAAFIFINFMQSEEVRRHLQAFGFELPVRGGR